MADPREGLSEVETLLAVAAIAILGVVALLAWMAL